MNPRGLFITLEGGEGTGKTTQIKLLADHLRAQGHDVITTREPGGTPEGESIRALFARRDGGDWTPMAECLLLYAARHMHVEHVIKPALARGAVVISDRFADSTRAYQGYGHGLDLTAIENIDREVLGGFKPDLTFIFDMPVEEGLKRSHRRLNAEGSAEDRFEHLEIAFHERMRQGYLVIAKKEPQRCVIVDVTQDINSIFATIKAVIPAKAGIHA